MLAYNVLTATGTISYFFPTLMGALGYKGRHVQCEFAQSLALDVPLIAVMTVPIYFISLFFALLFGWSADRTGKKAWHLLAACAMGTASFIVCAAARNYAVRYAFICFGGAGVWSAIPLFLSWMVTMFPGREQRGISIAIINGLGEFESQYRFERALIDRQPRFDLRILHLAVHGRSQLRHGFRHHHRFLGNQRPHRLCPELAVRRQGSRCQGRGRRVGSRKLFGIGSPLHILRRV